MIILIGGDREIGKSEDFEGVFPVFPVNEAHP
jgi:hypothetical protein